MRYLTNSNGQSFPIANNVTGYAAFKAHEAKLAGHIAPITLQNLVTGRQEAVTTKEGITWRIETGKKKEPRQKAVTWAKFSKDTTKPEMDMQEKKRIRKPMQIYAKATEYSHENLWRLSGDVRLYVQFVQANPDIECTEAATRLGWTRGMVQVYNAYCRDKGYIVTRKLSGKLGRS